jgi:hypothetical protein
MAGFWNRNVDFSCHGIVPQDRKPCFFCQAIAEGCGRASRPDEP